MLAHSSGLEDRLRLRVDLAAVVNKYIGETEKNLGWWRHDNRRHTRGEFNYAGNLFTEDPPAAGISANQINVSVGLLIQSGWTYDPLYGAWLRFVDDADNATAGQLHADTDRLTGRQLYFENFIIIFAEVDVISPTIWIFISSRESRVPPSSSAMGCDMTSSGAPVRMTMKKTPASAGR